MQDFVKGLAISQLIPKNKIQSLKEKWQIDKGVINFSTEKLIEVLILSVFFEKKNLRDIADSYGVPKSTLNDALRKRASGFFEELFSLAIQGLIGFTESRKDRQGLREILAIDSSVCSVHGSLAKAVISTKMDYEAAGIKLHAAFNVYQEPGMSPAS